MLPLFALSAAMFAGREALVLAIALGLVVGKPVGFLLAAALAVWVGVAVKPAAYAWRQLLGAGALAGIGFTMSLFIAGQAFAVADDFSAAKIAVFAASILSAIAGVALLWRPVDGDPPGATVRRR
ncbi:MAG: Na+/H+ antiporter NhaA [Casimicrobiaceae bacterium]